MASTGVVQDAASLQGSGRSSSRCIVATLENHLMFAAEAVYPVTGVSDEYWGEVLL
jgi:hypothetical protein